MESRKSLNLPTTIINNIIILNSEGLIKFSGPKIKKILLIPKVDLNKPFTANIRYPQNKQKWQKKINQAKKAKIAVHFQLKNPRQEYYLFPIHDRHKSFIIIATAEKLQQIRRIEIALSERVKELECLYNISYEIETHQDLHQALKKSIYHLIQGFQFPDSTGAIITIDNIKYRSRRYQHDYANELTQIIDVNGKNRGKIEVFYLNQARFLKEEKELLKEIAIMISKALEKMDLKIELEKHLNNLEEMVKAKTVELEGSRKRYEDLFNNAPDCIIISDEAGNIAKANPTFYDLYYHSKKSFIPLNYIANSIIENASEIWNSITKKLKRRAFLGSFELNLMDVKGNRYPVIGSFKRFIWKDIIFIEAIYKDIQFKKELENTLKQQKANLEKQVRERTADLEKRKKILIQKNKRLLELTEECGENRSKLEALFNSITDTIIVIDRNFRVIISNKKSISINGKCYQQLFSLANVCEKCPAVKAFEQSATHFGEKSKDDLRYSLSAFPILDKNEIVTSVIEICRDITKEILMKSQLIQSYKLASIGKLVAGIAHEINNPNTFIQGNIHIIQEAFIDILPILEQYYLHHPDLKIARLNYLLFKENIGQLIEDMKGGSHRIKKIIDGLKNFARKDEGQINEMVDLNYIISNNLRIVSKQVQKTAQLKFSLAQLLPKFKGNGQQFEQVLMNLLLNAAQAIDHPNGIIEVKTWFNDNTKEVNLQVIDNGRGIEEKDIKYIFDPFYTTKRDKGGTGLGLSITYGIVKEHGGTISVNSKKNQGATFTIKIPVKTNKDN